LLVARKFIASLAMSSPERELSMVARLVSMAGVAAETDTDSVAPAICNCPSMRATCRASSASWRDQSEKPLRLIVSRYCPASRLAIR
jgi:hypothetical protein